MNNEHANQEGQNCVTCRASDILKLLKTKDDRINFAKESSK